MLHRICLAGRKIRIYTNSQAYTGMRIGEMLALKWKDINFEENVLTL
jgi:integrase